MYENQHYGGDRQMKQNGNGRLAQEEASFRKAAADTQFFWNQVTRNNGALRKVQKVLNPQNKAREESQLFGSHSDVQQGIIQDSIPVERSGPGAENVPVLEKFSDLNNLPSFIARNIRLMKYESPSPIQKHSVPLGLAGMDLMCCAQTVTFLRSNCIKRGPILIITDFIHHDIDNLFTIDSCKFYRRALAKPLLFYCL